jgi:hypothetical protein
MVSESVREGNGGRKIRGSEKLDRGKYEKRCEVMTLQVLQGTAEDLVSTWSTAGGVKALLRS